MREKRSQVQIKARKIIDIDAWLNRLVDGYRLPPGVTIRRDLAAGSLVMIDCARLDHIIVGLLESAIKTMTDPAWAKSARADPTVTLRSRSAGPHVRIELIDNGPGMALGCMYQVFAPTLRLDRPTPLAILAAIRQVIQEQGGTIDVESAPDQGTDFIIWLPRHGRLPDIAANRATA